MFGAPVRQHPRHPDRGQLSPEDRLKLLEAEISEVDRYIDRHPDCATGLRGLMGKARARILSEVT